MVVLEWSITQTVKNLIFIALGLVITLVLLNRLSHFLVTKDSKSSKTQRSDLNLRLEI